MPKTSAIRMRVSGLFLLALAVALACVGLYLAHLALNWTLPNWLPPDFKPVPAGPPRTLAGLEDSPLGMAAAYLLAFGGIAGLNGCWMLALGRRNRYFSALLLLAFLVFVLVGLWAALDAKPWKGPS